MRLHTPLPFLCFAVLAVAVVPAYALVNPEKTQLPGPGWMTEVHAVLKREGRTAELCKGALIAPQWVLTSATCVYDVNRVADDEDGELQYIAKLGSNGDSVEVEEFFASDDGTVALLRLGHPFGQTFVLVGRQCHVGSSILRLGEEKSCRV